MKRRDFLKNASLASLSLPFVSNGFSMQAISKELFEYSKTFFKEFLNKEINNVFYNGASGILIPPILEKLGKFLS